jgi:hypothetical protein
MTLEKKDLKENKNIDYSEKIINEEIREHAIEQPLVKKRGRKPKNRDSMLQVQYEKNQTSSISIDKKEILAADSIQNKFSTQIKKPNLISKIENTILFFPIKSESSNTNFQNSKNSQFTSLNTLDPTPYDPNINLNMHADFENITSHSFAYVINEPSKNKNLNLNSINKNIKIIPILNEFIKSNSGKEMPTKTSVCCYWDTEPFDWEPLGLPEKKIGDTFYVKHCFCGFNCMASYNFRINDDKVWERYALINLMYKKMYNINQNIKVKLAPPIESQIKFGGIYNIDQFRKLCDQKFIKVQSFPLINIQSYLEEINIQTGDNQSANSMSQSEVKNYLDKVNNDYKLSRSKLSGQKNTLELCMGLKKL